MISKFDVQDLYRAQLSTIDERAFFLFLTKSHIVFMKTDDALGHKVNLKSQQISKN